MGRTRDDAGAIAEAYEVVTAECDALKGELETARLREAAHAAQFRHDSEGLMREVEEAKKEAER